MDQPGVPHAAPDPGRLASLERSLARSERRARAAMADADRIARQLAEVEALAAIGSWQWDDAQGRLRLSAGLCRMLGVGRRPGPRALTRAEFERRFPPSQRVDFEARVREALRADGTWEAEHAIVMADGSTRVMVSRGRARLRSDGGFEAIAGTLQDVTVARDCDARFRAAFADAPIAIALLGLVGTHRGRWMIVNPELELLLGADRGALDGAEADAHVHPRDLPRTSLELGRLARAEIDRARCELQLRRLDGTWLWVRCNLALVSSAAGVPAYAIAHYLDVSEQKRFERDVTKLTERDSLTALFNRRRFEEELDRALAHARRYATSGALIAFDLDSFKQVNDGAGHATGDALLARVADAVGAALRSTDTFARTGGDEFAILLPDTTLSDARAVADKVLRTIRRRGHVGLGAPVTSVTASVGITVWGEREARGAQQMLVQADAAMYEAKSLGGDRYAVYPPGDADDTDGL